MDKDKDKVAERKAQLLREAEEHRNAIVLARHHIKYGMKPEVIIHNAIDNATWAIRARVDNLLTPAGLSLTAVAPYALRVFNILRRRGMVNRRTLGRAVAAGLVAAGAAWYLKRKRDHAEMHA